MSDRENQQKHIRIALSHMQAEEKEAYEAQTKYEKMSRTLGILTGILLVLLMF
jgi:stage III sporulation protein AB